MLRRVLNAYSLATISALVVFLQQAKPGVLVGFIASLPHWPARLLRLIGVGRILDAAAIPVCDSLIRVIGYHPWVEAIGVIFVLIVMTAAADPPGVFGARFKWAIPLLLLPVGFSFTSAWMSGMHVSRAGWMLLGGGSPDPERIVADLSYGMEPVNNSGPMRVLTRLTNIWPATAWISDKVGDEEVRKLREQIVEKARIPVAEAAVPGSVLGDKRERVAMLQSMSLIGDLVQRLQLGAMVSNATLGRGGDPDQPWRTLQFSGPLGPIVFRTNFLPPDPRLIPLIPGAYEEGRGNAFERLKRAGRGFGAEAVPFFDQADKLNYKPNDVSTEPNDVSTEPDDVLWRMWYSTLASFFGAKGVVTAITEGNQEFRFPTEDNYGELQITLHNSCASFQRTAGGPGDLATAGWHSRNEIHVWMDEREEYREEGHFWLQALAKLYSDRKSESLTGGPEDLAFVTAMAAVRPADRVQIVLLHELSHWTTRVLLQETQRSTLQGPALTEGMALWLDEFPKELMPESGLPEFKSLDPQERIPLLAYLRAQENAAPVNLHPSHESCQSYIPAHDWACEWLKQKRHPLPTPRDLVVMNEKEFYSSPQIFELYVDSWALSALFGPGLLQNSLEKHISMREAILRDDFYSRPWIRLQNELRHNLAHSSRLRRIFRGCK